MDRSNSTSTSDHGHDCLGAPPAFSAATRPRPALVPRLLAVLALFALVGGAVWWFGLRPKADPYPGGRAAARASDFEQALHSARLLEDQGRDDEAALVRGESLLNQGQVDEALTVVGRVPEDSPWRIEAATIAARCYQKRKDFGPAQRMFRAVLVRQPDNADAHRGLATMLYDLGNLAQAQAEAEEVARLDPSDGRPYRLIGLILKDLNQSKPAIAAYEEALRRGLSPKARKEVRLELAQTLAWDNQFEQALAQLDGFEPDPDQEAQALAIRGDCLTSLQRAQEAARLLDDALRKFPTSADLLWMRGRVYIDAGQPQAAVAPLTRATEVDPNNYQANYRLALALEQLGRSAEAKVRRDRANEIKTLFQALTEANVEAMEKPQDPAVRYKAAELCERLGKKDLAETWRKAAQECEQVAGGRPPG